MREALVEVGVGLVHAEFDSVAGGPVPKLAACSCGQGCDWVGPLVVDVESGGAVPKLAACSSGAGGEYTSDDDNWLAWNK